MQIFKAGDEIYGYCQGYFGRDDYRDKTCVFVTLNYAVFEDDLENGTIVNDYEGLAKDAEEWKNPENSYRDR